MLILPLRMMRCNNITALQGRRNRKVGHGIRDKSSQIGIRGELTLLKLTYKYTIVETKNHRQRESGSTINIYKQFKRV